jgi:hypothetical protein
LTDRGAPSGRSATVGILGFFRKVLMNWNRFTLLPPQDFLSDGAKVLGND